MSKLTFTEDQQRAIDTLDKSILVAAAAGSGKTAVLIERIINIILQGQANVDELLVVTFTNAAATEMKVKLQKALRKRMEEDPKQAGPLSAQLDRMYQAYISTFHSFALRVIREYFYKIDVEPGFGICDEVQATILQTEAMEELFEECFEHDDLLPGGSFRDFLRHYSGDRNEDALIRDLIANYGKLRSIPRYFEWADDRAEMLRYPETGYEDSPVTALLRQTLASELEKAVRDAVLAESLVEAAGLPRIAEAIRAEKEGILAVQALLGAHPDGDAGGAPAVSLEEFFRAAAAVQFPALRARKDEKETYALIKDDIKTLRERYKGTIRGLAAKYAEPGLEERFREMDAAYGYTKYYLEILKAFEERFAEKKKERNLMDFSDIEHTCAAILEDPEVSEVLRNRFRYIFIDEYQDTNKLQEYLIGMIARPDNLFKVGDVKQSIYRFRQSDPKIFEQVRREYDREDRPDAVTIDLNRNFRSNRRTIDYINTIFEAVMPGYDEKARLYQDERFQRDPEEYDLMPEVHVLVEDGAEELLTDGDEEEEYQMSRSEAEARHIADIIHGILGQEFYDGKIGARRKATPRDIVILMRGIKSHAGIYHKVLTEQRIDSHVNDEEGYFDTVEVSIAVSLLKVIDNFRQDIPLLAVLRSEIGGFTPEELAEIRASANETGERMPYHKACTRYLTAGSCPELRATLSEILSRLERWRSDAGSMALDEFIWHVLTDSGYYLYAGAMYGGRQRQANLRTLADRARLYQDAGVASLGGFLRYVEILKSKEVRTGQAVLVSEDDDVVRIMTIHKSKGLEFPFVIVAGMGRPIRRDTAGKGFLIDSDIGVSMSYVNKERKFWRSTILQRIIAEKGGEEAFQEELRILYVALTRAREKLILVGTVRNRERLEQTVPGTGSYFEIIKGQLRTDQNLFRISEAGELKPQRRTNNLEQFLQARAGLRQDEAERFRKQVAERLEYRYPEEQALSAKAKYSVSELRALKEKTALPERRISLNGPAFEADGGITGAEIGTGYHRIMEALDFSRCGTDGPEDAAATERYIRETAEALRDSGAIEAGVFARIDRERILDFFRSPIGKRAVLAAAAGTMHKEWPFTLRTEVDGQQVLVQGIIDCCFEEAGSLILIDYKSNYVRGGADGAVQEVVERYREQLRLYREALEAGTGKTVAESCLYLFAAGRAVPVAL